MSFGGELELDFERYEYVRIDTFGGDSYHLRVACLHRNPMEVRSLAGEVVAMLCYDCDTQLPVMRE